MDVETAQLWFCGKEMLRGKKLGDYLGRNEKTKVTVKLHKRGTGKPGREPLMSEDERKRMMMHAYNRQEQLKVSHFSVSRLGSLIQSIPGFSAFDKSNGCFCSSTIDYSPCRQV